MKEDKMNCFVLEGKMALPNQYFAGRLGSQFIIALRDQKKIQGRPLPEMQHDLHSTPGILRALLDEDCGKLGGSGQ